MDADLAEGITFDVDFLGTSKDAKALAGKLGGKLYVASLDDATPSAAKVVLPAARGKAQLDIDFLATMAGGGEESARNRAIEIEVEGSHLYVLHPFDVLRTRVSNLALLPPRTGNPRYIAQARLATRVLREHLNTKCKGEGSHRYILKVAEAVIELAQSKIGLDVWDRCGIDVLNAVPVEAIPVQKFVNVRWPQVMKVIEELRRKRRH